MSRIFNMIEKQVNLIMGLVLNKETLKSLQEGEITIGQQTILPVAYFITMIIFLFVILWFGVWLWNRGIQPVFPNVVASIDPSMPGQFKNPFTQMIVTLIALMTLF